jgi:NTE family protein
VPSHHSPSFFDGLPADELTALLGELERRRYPAGAVVIAEGDRPKEIAIIEEGRAEVWVSNREGVEHRVGRVGPGATLGEMSLFTGQPAVGTVRAASELDVLVMTDAEFDRLTTRYPQVYRNLGRILSDRLARTNRLAVREVTGQLGYMHETGAPPELGYALACSVAWHTRAPTLLLYLGDELPPDLAALAEHSPNGDGAAPRAHIRLAGSLDQLRMQTFGDRIDEYFRRFEHILVQTKSTDPPPLRTARPIELTYTGSNGFLKGVDTRLTAWAPSAAPLRPDRDGIIQIPRLRDEDVEGLRSGLLPPGTPGGRAIGWAARDFAKLKVGLALGAGSLRGYAHFGVLRALERAGVTTDYLAGTSVGASIAGLYAYGFTPMESADILDRCGETLFRPTIPHKGFLSSRALRRFLHEMVGDAKIEELPLPLAIIAADVLTGQEVIFRRGLLYLAVLASISIPGVYPAQAIDGHLLVDGGILNPVPTSATASMGADTVIAVRLSSNLPAPETEAVARETPGATPSALSVLLRSVDTMQGRIVSDPADATTITITPSLDDLPGAKLRNFKMGRRYIEAGEAAAEAALPRIHAALPWLRGT